MDPRDIAELAKHLPIDRLYTDALKGPAKEIGALGTDVVRTARLLFAPVQLAGAWQVRFARYCKRIAEKVPDERRTEVPLLISGPVLDALQYTLHEDLLTEMMLDLLACAMDTQRVDDAHPAFGHILKQLSPDEAMVLFHLKKRKYGFTEYQKFHQDKNWFDKAVIEANDFPLDSLARPKLYDVYLKHLALLGLADKVFVSRTYERNAENVQTGNRDICEATLNAFGEMFARACVPDELPVDQNAGVAGPSAAAG
jgi:hypothetical protein